MFVAFLSLDDWNIMFYSAADTADCLPKHDNSKYVPMNFPINISSPSLGVKVFSIV